LDNFFIIIDLWKLREYSIISMYEKINLKNLLAKIDKLKKCFFNSSCKNNYKLNIFLLSTKNFKTLIKNVQIL